jgi:acyl dehydratase
LKFADFHAGQVIEAGPYHVDEPAVLAFAREFDPQWFHTEPEAAAQGRFGGLRLGADAALQGSESFASPGVAHVRWPHPVRPGDALRLRATVIDARRARSQGALGILRWRWQLFNQHGREVLDLEATSLFDLAKA